MFDWLSPTRIFKRMGNVSTGEPSPEDDGEASHEAKPLQLIAGAVENVDDAGSGPSSPSGSAQTAGSDGDDVKPELVSPKVADGSPTKSNSNDSPRPQAPKKRRRSNYHLERQSCQTMRQKLKDAEHATETEVIHVTMLEEYYAKTAAKLARLERQLAQLKE